MLLAFDRARDRAAPPSSPTERARGYSSSCANAKAHVRIDDFRFAIAVRFAERSREDRDCRQVEKLLSDAQREPATRTIGKLTISNNDRLWRSAADVDQRHAQEARMIRTSATALIGVRLCTRRQLATAVPA